MNIKKYVGSKIKEFRIRNGMNQEQLADKLETTKQSVSRYESGEREPNQDLLFKLAGIFNVSINDLFPPLKQTNKNIQTYNYLPTTISAGLPLTVEAITQADKIPIPDEIMGKYAGRKDIYFIKVNGESMNKIIPHDSLVAIRPVSSIHDLKTGDIVVYRKDGEYAIKRLIIDGDKLIFKPESHDQTFYDDVVNLNNEQEISIKGKVVLYIVNLD